MKYFFFNAAGNESYTAFISSESEPPFCAIASGVGNFAPSKSSLENTSSESISAAFSASARRASSSAAQVCPRSAAYSKCASESCSMSASPIASNFNDSSSSGIESIIFRTRAASRASFDRTTAFTSPTRTPYFCAYAGRYSSRQIFAASGKSERRANSAAAPLSTASTQSENSEESANRFCPSSKNVKF